MKVLVDLDEGLLQLVDAEASAAGATRLKVVRELLVEGLRARAAGRGEEFPEVEAWVPATVAGPEIISATVNDGTRAVILSRPVRLAHEAVTEPSYNHTRGDSALNPCSICASAQELAETRPTEHTFDCNYVRTFGLHDCDDRCRCRWDCGRLRGDLVHKFRVEIKSSSSANKSVSVSEIASFAQTVAEERMTERAAKPV